MTQSRRLRCCRIWSAVEVQFSNSYIYTISNGPLHYMHIVKYISTTYYYHNLGFDPSLQFQLEPGCRRQSSIRHTLDRISREKKQRYFYSSSSSSPSSSPSSPLVIMNDHHCDLHGIEVSFGFPITFLLCPSPLFHLENVTFKLKVSIPGTF